MYFDLDENKNPVRTMHPRKTNHLIEATKINNKTVTTFFLGYWMQGVSEHPILFETTVISDDGCEGSFERYRTWAEAKAGHAKWVTRVAGGHISDPLD